MARIIAFECDICTKIVKCSKCTCCGGNRLPEGWTMGRVKNENAPDLPPEATDEERAAQYEYYCACDSGVCQDALLAQIDTMGGEIQPASDDDEAPDAQEPHKPGVVH